MEVSLDQRLKVEQSTVSQCNPWEALPCFLSLTQLCNGKSIWLYSLFVFGSKPCPVFVHTVMHLSRLLSFLLFSSHAYSVYVKVLNYECCGGEGNLSQVSCEHWGLLSLDKKRSTVYFSSVNASMPILQLRPVLSEILS